MGRKRILIVDDEVGVTRGLKLYLEATGAYEVRAENHGSHALVTAREFNPHLILLDIVMPDADGATVAAAIKMQPMLQQVPIVFLTALVSKREVSPDGRTIGGHAFLAKPVDPDRVIACIERHLHD